MSISVTFPAASESSASGNLTEIFSRFCDAFMLVEAEEFAEYLKATYGNKAAYRNGYRIRYLKTAYGVLKLHKPQFRSFPFRTKLFDRYQRVDSCLEKILSAAYTGGVSVRDAGRLAGVSSSSISRLTAKQNSTAFLDRPILEETPYIYFDATYVKVRTGSRYYSKALFTAYGVTDSGCRTILGAKLCSQESEQFWLTFFDELLDRGLRGVKLVVTDERSGIAEAVQKKFLGSSWQVCMVHLKRRVRNLIPKPIQKDLKKELNLFLPAAALGYDMLYQKLKSLDCTAAAACLEKYHENALNYHSFPRDHWKKIYSTNGVERLNRDLKIRMKKSVAFPDDNAVMKLAVPILEEIDAKWRSMKYLDMSKMPKDIVTLSAFGVF